MLYCMLGRRRQGSGMYLLDPLGVSIDMKAI